MSGMGGTGGATRPPTQPDWAQQTGPAYGGGGGILPGDWRARNDTQMNDWYESFRPQAPEQPESPIPGSVQAGSGSGWRNMQHQAPDVPQWLQDQWGWPQAQPEGEQPDQGSQLGGADYQYSDDELGQYTNLFGQMFPGFMGGGQQEGQGQGGFMGMPSTQYQIQPSTPSYWGAPPSLWQPRYQHSGVNY